MSRDPSMHRWATGALLVVALVAGGCGSGAVDGPGEDDAASDQTDDSGESGGSGNAEGGGGGNDEGGGGGDRYSWGLPVGDLTPDAAFIIYQALRDGGCDAGETAVNDHGSILTDEQRRLYDAAIAVCRGDVESGRALFAGAGYGDSRSACFVHAAVVSVLDQRPPDTSGCPPNSGPGRASTTGSEESTTSTESTSTTEGETTTTEVDGVGDGGG